MSRLADIHRKSAAGNGTPAPSSRLRGLLEQDLRGELVRMPIVGEVWVELIGHDANNDVEGDSLKTMEASGVPPGGVFGLSYGLERAKRTLANACREPSDRVTPVGTVEEWGAFDDDVINACWEVYGDVRERLDPIGVDKLTADDIKAIDDAIEKKNTTVLRFFGVAKLSLYLSTMAARHTTSPTPPSSPGGSSPAT